jgi:hypothetical protein
MLLNFYRGSQPRVCLESQRRIWIGLLRNAGTIEIWGILGDRLNAFCIMRRPWAYGYQG